MFPITVESRRKKEATLARVYPEAKLIDVTSKAEEPWVRFSPFYPHGEIPIPNWENRTAESVEGIWQGLKVFEQEAIDDGKFSITTMQGIKRSTRSRGNVLGHQYGADRSCLLSYLEARYRIYLPCYRWVLEHRLAEEVEKLRRIANAQPLVLLDYETNGNVEELSKPLSHAALVRCWLLDAWPSG